MAYFAKQHLKYYTKYKIDIWGSLQNTLQTQEPKSMKYSLSRLYYVMIRSIFWKYHIQKEKYRKIYKNYLIYKKIKKKIIKDNIYKKDIEYVNLVIEKIQKRLCNVFDKYMRKFGLKWRHYSLQLIKEYYKKKNIKKIKQFHKELKRTILKIIYLRVKEYSSISNKQLKNAWELHKILIKEYYNIYKQLKNVWELHKLLIHLRKIEIQKEFKRYLYNKVYGFMPKVVRESKKRNYKYKFRNIWNKWLYREYFFAPRNKYRPFKTHLKPYKYDFNHFNYYYLYKYNIVKTYKKQKQQMANFYTLYVNVLVYWTNYFKFKASKKLYKIFNILLPEISYDSKRFFKIPFVYETRVPVYKKRKRRKNEQLFTFGLVKLFYVIYNHRQLRNIGRKAKMQSGVFQHNYFTIIESKLASYIYRLSFFSTLFESIEFVKGCNVWINKKYKESIHYPVKLFDIVGFRAIYKSYIYWNYYKRLKKQAFLFVAPKNVYVSWKFLFTILIQRMEFHDIVNTFEFDYYRICNYIE